MNNKENNKEHFLKELQELSSEFFELLGNKSLGVDVGICVLSRVVNHILVSLKEEDYEEARRLLLTHYHTMNEKFYGSGKS